MDLTLLSIFGYILVQLTLGAWVSRRIKTESDYLIAGRSLGYGLTTFTVFATWFGAETVIGAGGSVYASGFSATFVDGDPFGYGLCIILMGLFLAVPLWKRKMTTVGDFYRDRFSPTVEKLAVLLTVPTSLLWAAAQIRAFGQVIAASSGQQTELAITIAAAVVIIYTISGGLLADAWTDLLQGLILIAGIVLLFVMVFSQHGFGILTPNPEAAAAFAAQAAEEPVTWLMQMENWAIPILGNLVVAELVSRIIAAKNPQVAQRSALLGGSMYILVGLLPVLLGLAAINLVPGLDDPEHALPALAQQYLPVVLYPLFAGALVSAILSTVDSTLLVASSLVSHNVVVPLRKGMTEEQKVLVARVGVAVFGIVAYAMALSADGIYDLIEASSSFGSAGLFVALALGLYTTVGGKLAGLGAMAAGAVVSLLGNLLWLDATAAPLTAVLGPLADPLGTYPFLLSIAAALATYLALAAYERRQAPPLPVTAAPESPP